MEITAVTKICSQTAVETTIDGFSVITEPPVAAGGTGQYPPATRLAIAALLNCSFSAVRTFCEKREISTEGLQMDFSGSFEDGVYKEITFALSLPLEFPEKYRNSLGNVLDSCAVKNMVKNLPVIQLSLK